MKGPRPRHLPQRTCIGCRQEAGKRALIRIVRTPENQLAVDSRGRANGRGAYLHSNRLCWERALKGGTLAYALKCSPAPDDIDALRAFARTLPIDEAESDGP